MGQVMRTQTISRSVSAVLIAVLVATGTLWSAASAWALSPGRGVPPGTDSTVTPESVTPHDIDSTMTLDSIVQVALRENAGLRSVRATWEAMQERPSQAGALPNPMFEYGGMDAIDGGNWPNTHEKRFMVEQSFPWFGKRGLREKVATTEAKATATEYDATARDVILMVKQMYFELYSVQQSLSITRAEKDVLEQVQRIAEAKYATGGVDQTDAIKAQTEVSMLEARLLELTQEEITVKATLNRLLNRPAGSPLGRAVTRPQREFVFNAEDLFALAERTRPEIQWTRLQTESFEYQRDLMRKESFPDYRLGAEYRSFRGGDDMVMFTVGFDLPIWRGKYRASVREAEKMIESGKSRLDEVEKQISFDVQDAYSKLLTGKRLADLYETALVPQAEARFEASEAGYRTGEGDFLDLLESERFLLNARLMSATSEAELGILLARLERAVGTDLTGGAPRETPTLERTPGRPPEQTPDDGNGE